ncbi:hypothetical protein RRG08_017504 [Elysia crispata]|uniref:Uncharacterized protein n=1 Tax=Elysia crispata TaxID=231223 RepID=A0AAE1DDR3_9GAST|nr:hypothetical protein RRG08_017504 [Elysia crispata]
MMLETSRRPDQVIAYIQIRSRQNADMFSGILLNGGKDKYRRQSYNWLLDITLTLQDGLDKDLSWSGEVIPSPPGKQEYMFLSNVVDYEGIIVLKEEERRLLGNLPNDMINLPLCRGISLEDMINLPLCRGISLEDMINLLLCRGISLEDMINLPLCRGISLENMINLPLCRGISLVT